MRCTEVKPKLADYSIGLLGEQERRAIEEHVAQCALCARELRALERVEQVLTALTPEEPPVHLWQSIRAQIDAQSAPTRRSFWNSWFTLSRLAVGSAVAVTILLVAVYLGVPRLPDQTPQAPADAQQIIHAHQMMSWGDPLSDRAALGAMLASRPSLQEETE